jgi:DNA-binding response OmpR family regulator
MNDLVVINNPEKPLSMYEYLNPISAVVPIRSGNIDDHVVRFADVTVDVGRRKIMRGGEIVNFTRAEYNLLLFFLQNVDRALTRDTILNAVWGYDCYPTTRTVDAHVCRLRRKLESDPATPRHFLTIHGVGYRFLA